MTLFLLSNVDHFICKKLGHFIFLAFVKRELNRTLNIAAIYVRIFRVIKAITGAGGREATTGNASAVRRLPLLLFTIIKCYFPFPRGFTLT